MMPWRKIAVLGFGAGLVIGCTVTTSDGGADSGIYGETGGTGNQGGAGSTGGAPNGGASSVIVCNPGSEQQGSCGECLQTAAPLGMCDEYKVCRAVAGCTDIIGAMATCMSTKTDSNKNLLPTAKADCLAETPAISANTAAGLAANTLWGQIEIDICGDLCWAI